MAPALALNYFGQGALLIGQPEAVVNPFYHLVPGWALFPMVALATAAAVIASQAVISGAFSLTKQAVQLGFLPRMTLVHTSARESGQIYIPSINWLLCAAVLSAVIGFGTSSELAGAYGIAVTATMSVDTLLTAAAAQGVAGGSHVLAFCDGGYTTNLPIADVTQGKAWIAFRYDGAALPPEHGGPARLLVPHLYFWKSAKWVRGLRLTATDEPGFWEVNGYHNYGDPWQEQRYWSD